MSTIIKAPLFNFFEIDTSFEAIKSCENYPEAFYYEIFVIAKATANKEIRTECANIIKKQAPEAIQLAFKSRKKLTQKGGVKSVNARLISILEYGLLSEELDLFKLYTLIHKEPELGLYSFSTEFLDRLLEYPDLLGRFNGMESLKIGLKKEGEGYAALLQEVPKLTSLKSLEIDGDFTQLPEDLGNLVNLKKMKLTMPFLKDIPASIVNLKSLKKLSIKGAYVFGNRAANTNLIEFGWLTELQKLKVLKLHYVGVQDLSEVVFPASLKDIELFSLDALTALPQDLQHLKKIKRFKVTSNSLQQLPSGIQDLPKLELFEVNASELKSISADFFFGFESKPNLVTKIGNRNVDIEPMTEVSTRSEVVLDTPKLLNYVLDNAAFFTELETISINCPAPETKNTNTLAAFKSLKHLSYKLEPNLEWLFDGLDTCKNLESITLFKNTSYATRVDEEPSLAVIPKGLSEVKKLKQLTIQFENHLVLNTDVLPKQMEQLTLKGLKEIVPGNTKITAHNVYVEHTCITNLKTFYELIDANKMNLGKNNSFVLSDPTFSFLKQPEQIKTYEYAGPAKNIGGLLKRCPNLENLTVEFPKDKPEYCEGLSAYENFNLKKLKIQNYKGDSETLKTVLEQLPNLEYLELRSCEGLNDFPKVNLKALKILEIYECDIKTISGLNVQNIEAFKVSFCEHFDYDAVSSVSQWKSLKYLWFEQISNAMKSYPKAISNLNLDTLVINGKYSNRTIPKWLGTMKSLRVLGVEGFKQVTLPEELAALTQLKVLSINGCDFTERISESFRNLNLEKLVYWTSKFSGSNMKSEIYEPLAGNLVPQRYFDDEDRYEPFQFSKK